MPAIVLKGVPSGTSQDVLDQIEADVKALGHAIIRCPTNWIDVFFDRDLSERKHETIWVYFETGLFETKPLLEAEEIAKQMCEALCPKIHRLLNWVGHVEAFPVALSLHLHSIYPHDD